MFPTHRKFCCGIQVQTQYSDFINLTYTMMLLLAMFGCGHRAWEARACCAVGVRACCRPHTVAKQALCRLKKGSSTFKNLLLMLWRTQSAQNYGMFSTTALFNVTHLTNLPGVDSCTRAIMHLCKRFNENTKNHVQCVSSVESRAVIAPTQVQSSHRTTTQRTFRIASSV